MTSFLADAVTVFRGNPFTDSGVAHRARMGRLLLTPPAARAFRGAQRGSVPFTAEDLVLAIAHAQACALLDPKAVLTPSVVPDSDLAELPRVRQDYARIALAAGRCFRALQSLPGTSSGLARVRHDAWTRALGGSLVDALDTESLRRGQPLVLCGESGTGRRALARAVLAGLPAPPGRPPWTAPSVASWASSAPRTPPDGLVVEGLVGRPPDALRQLTAALEQPSGPRLAIVCGPWDQVAQALPSSLAARLAPLRLEIPPLRERLEDLDAVVVARLVTWGHDLKAAGAPGVDFDPVLDWFAGTAARDHTWPGNLDEVDTAVQALVLGTRPSLPAASGAPRPVPAAEDLPPGLSQGTWSDRQVRDWYLQRVHGLTGAIGRTAHILGLDRSTVRLRLREADGT